MKFKFENYETLMAFVRQNCDEEELKRVDEEFVLFEKRNWQKYILVLANVLTNPELCLFIGGGSAFDSYVLYKICNINQKNIEKLNNTKGKDILFNDALRFKANLVNPVEDRLTEMLAEFESFFYSASQKLNLAFTEWNTSTKSAQATEVMIISDHELTDKEMEIIFNEKKASSDAENNVLRNVFIIKIAAYKGI